MDHSSTWSGNSAPLYQTDLGTCMNNLALWHWQVQSQKVSTAYSSGGNPIGSWAQWDTLLAAPLILQNHVMVSWIKHVWVSTQESGITLLTNFADYPPQCQGNMELICLFLQSGIEQPILQLVNQCHMYLHMFLISDIVSGTGDYVLPQFWDHFLLAETHLEWPHTPSPSPHAWNMWKQALTQALHLGRQQCLAIPLGKWYMSSTSHGWFYHRRTNSLWHNEVAHWWHHGGMPQCTWQQGFHQTGQANTPPPMAKLEKATIAYSGQKLVLTGSSPCEVPCSGMDPCHCTHINKFPLSGNCSFFLYWVPVGDDEHPNWRFGFAVSNCSFKDDARVAAWLIEGSDSMNQLIGTWHTPGTMADHSLFRSELAGIVGALHTISFWRPQNQPKFWLACNGLLVISHLKSPKPIKPMEPHVDLLCTAWALLLLCGYNVELVFVKGHQDMGKPMILSWDAWLNVKADALAKAKVAIPYTGPVHYKLLGNVWACYTGNQWVVKQFDGMLCSL